MHAKSLVCKMLGDVSKPGKGVFLLTLVCFCQSSKRYDKAVLEGSGKYVWYLLEGQSICDRAWWGFCPNLMIWWYLPFSETILSILYLIKIDIDIFPISPKKRNTPSILAPHLLLKKTVPFARAVGMLPRVVGGRASHPNQPMNSFFWMVVVRETKPVGWSWMISDGGLFEWWSWWMISGFWLHLFSSTIHRVGHHQFLVWLVSPIQLCLWWFWASSADSRDVNRHSPDVRCATQIGRSFGRILGVQEVAGLFRPFFERRKKHSQRPGAADLGFEGNKFHL